MFIKTGTLDKFVTLPYLKLLVEKVPTFVGYNEEENENKDVHDPEVQTKVLLSILLILSML